MTSPAQRRSLDAIQAMIDIMPGPAADQVAAALHAAVCEGSPEVRLAQREHALGFLAGMIGEEMGVRARSDRRPPRVPRASYDRGRPESAPTSHKLVRAHGSWIKACRAASALGPESDRDASPGKPWPTPSLGRRRNPSYSREEIIAAVAEVAGSLGCKPGELSSHGYYTYVDEGRKRARSTGAPPPARWPTQRSIERFFKSWRSVLAAQ